MIESNAIWISMFTRDGYFRPEDYTGPLECGNVSITGNNFRHNVGCPLQSGGLVFVQCLYSKAVFGNDYDFFKENFDYFWDRFDSSAITANYFEDEYDQYYLMDSNYFIDSSDITSIASSTKPDYYFTIPTNYVLVQGNTY